MSPKSISNGLLPMFYEIIRLLLKYIQITWTHNLFQFSIFSIYFVNEFNISY